MWIEEVKPIAKSFWPLTAIEVFLLGFGVGLATVGVVFYYFGKLP